MWISPRSVKSQPVRSITFALLLYSSIHSSLDEARVPAHATSFTSTVCGSDPALPGVGLGDGVGDVAVGVGKKIEFGCRGVP